MTKRFTSILLGLMLISTLSNAQKGPTIGTLANGQFTFTADEDKLITILDSVMAGDGVLIKLAELHMEAVCIDTSTFNYFLLANDSLKNYTLGIALYYEKGILYELLNNGNGAIVICFNSGDVCPPKLTPSGEFECNTCEGGENSCEKMVTHLEGRAVFEDL